MFLNSPQPFHCRAISDNITKVPRPVLFYPKALLVHIATLFSRTHIPRQLVSWRLCFSCRGRHDVSSTSKRSHSHPCTQTHTHTRKTHANTHTHRLLDERMEDRHGPRVVPRRLSGHAGEWSPLLGQKRWQLGKNGFVPEQPVRISISMSAGDLQYACICQQPTGSRRWGRACFTLETRSRYGGVGERGGWKGSPCKAGRQIRSRCCVEHKITLGIGETFVIKTG